MPTNYEDGDFSTAQQNGPETQSRPFSETGDAAHRVITRPMIVNLADYSPLALDTAHPTIATAYLVKETNFQPQSCGVMTFDRVYATIPSTRDDVFTGTIAYSYPGYFIAGTGGDPDEFWSQKSLPTGSITDYSYFLPGVSAGITTFDDVTESDVFSPTDKLTGQSVRILTATTDPTATDYKADVAAGDYLTIESNITRYMGNIIQKADVKVRAR